MTIFSYGQGMANWGSLEAGAPQLSCYPTRHTLGRFDHQSTPIPTLASETGITGKDGTSSPEEQRKLQKIPPTFLFWGLIRGDQGHTRK